MAIALFSLFFVESCLNFVVAETIENSANTSFHLLEEPVGARLIAMGTGGTAASGLGFIYYNPSSPAFLNEPYISAEYGQYSSADLKRGYFETAWPFSKWFLSTGIHTASVQGLVPVSDDGKIDYNNTFSFQYTQLAVGAGIKKDNYFALGVSVSGLQERIQDFYSYGISANIGLQYSPFPDNFMFGISAMNIGLSTRMVDPNTNMPDTTFTWSELNLPSNGRFGVSWNDTLGTVEVSAVADIQYRYSNGLIMLPIGVEVKPLPQVAFRLGKRINHDTELINFGFGLNVAPISFDLGFSVPKLVDDAELKWVLNFKYRLKSNIKKT